MGIFQDLIQFIGCLALGGKDPSQAFLDPLATAERYLRWGNERGDVRDYLKSLDQLELARDEDAAKPEMLLRKYACYADATEGAIAQIVKRHTELADKARSTHNDTSREREGITAQMKQAQKRLDDLKKEGSLIKARDEEKHLEELRVKLVALDRQLEDGEVSPQVLSSFDNTAREVERLLSQLERNLVSLETNPTLPPQAVAELRDRISELLEQKRAQLEELSPVKTATS